MKKKLIISSILILAIGLFFRIFCGIFIIHPIGAIPEGTTIIYWRTGMNLPFIASADGLLDKSGAGVSLWGRGMMLAKVAESIKENEIFRIDYSETIYLWSTGGKKFEK
tara:strand:- start:268 stop:594 length:327 start_codon:yes stop_codon:yes gene_type:complete